MGSGKRRRAVRIGDVAAAAGVSRTTASDALNGTGRVSDETRALVEATAARLGFRANHYAQMLRGGRSRILGFVNSMTASTEAGRPPVPDSSDPDSAIDMVRLEGAEYFTALLTATSTAALSRGYAVILLPPSPDASPFNLMIADGIMLHDPVVGSSLVAEFRHRDVPLVTTGRLPDGDPEGTTWVDSDIADAAERVLDHMYDRGSRRFALVSNPPIRSYTIDTVEAYGRWTAKHGIQSQIVYTDARSSEGAAYEASRTLFADTRPPDAVFAPVDRLAIGAMIAAREHGLSVPSDLLVAAGSDSARARTSAPPITAVEHNTDLIGHRAVELLIDQVETGLRQPQQVVVEATLRIRESTGPR